MKDLIYEALRERIVFGELSPGARLVEADLAARFECSKTPVREALLSLEAEGLVTLRSHRGAEVSRLSLDEYRDLQFVRDALEFGALDEIIASMDERRLAEAAVHLAEMESAFAADDYKRYRRAQRRLHQTIMGAPGHPTLPELAGKLNDRLDRYGRLLLADHRERWAGDLDFNRRRVRMIRDRDAAGVVRMVSERHGQGYEFLRDRLGAVDRAANLDGHRKGVAPRP